MLRIGLSTPTPLGEFGNLKPLPNHNSDWQSTKRREMDQLDVPLPLTSARALCGYVLARTFGFQNNFCTFKNNNVSKTPHRCPAAER